MRGDYRFLILTPALAALLAAGAAPLSAQEATAPPTSLLASPAVAAVPALRVRAGTHPAFDRLVFDWPRGVTYRLSRAEGRVTIHFDAPARAQPAGLSLLTRLRDFRAETGADGNLTASFSVAPQAQIKDFFSDHSLVIDVTGNVPAAKPVVKAPPPAKTAVPPVPAPTPVAAKPAAAPVAKVEAAAPAAPAAAPPPVSATAVMSAAIGTDAIGELGDTPVQVAAFDPHVPLRAVIWQRAGVGTIVFERRLTLSLAELTAGQEPPKLALTPFDLPNASGFRFNLPDHAELRASLDGTAWKIFLTQQAPDLPVSSPLVAQPDFALGSRFVLPMSGAPEPIHFTDPIVGDELILLPMEQSDAFNTERRMADFLILPAAQGLVVKPLADRVTMRAVSDGVEITGEGGLHLSSAVDTGVAGEAPQKTRARAAGKSLFDLVQWRGKGDETFTQARQRLQQTVIDVPDRERARARMDLARFYFARGYGEEAAALLNMLAQQAPDLKAHSDFLALLGAAKILAYRPAEGLQDLTDAAIDGQPEIDLWQAVALAELRRWSEAEAHFVKADTVLAGYPEPFYSRFSVLAVESALAISHYDEGAAWLKRLADNPHSENADPAIEYLGGAVKAQQGKAQDAQQMWRDVAASRDRLYKVRAELALIDLGVANGSLTPAQAADRLEALRFGWRGDDLEADILHRLGQFYIQARNVKSGLGILNQALQLYPDSPLAPEIRTEMATTFHDVFLGELGQKLSPLDALTLYQQYSNLMPAGADGIATTRNLAERLVAIDLLDQAGALLDDLVKNKLQGEDKARVGARLAAIRLLDHKPDAALAALDASKVDNLPADAQNERVLLRAKALADSGKPDDALALVKDNPSPAAKLLRADVLTRAQRWPEAAAALLDVVGPPPQAGAAPLRPDQADALVNAAVAFSLAGDQTGLSKLGIDYDAAMSGMPQADTFRILTHPEKTAALHDIAAVQTRISDVDMFQGFLENYRKAGAAPGK